MVIREAQAVDSAFITVLLGQLGYPNTPEQVAQRQVLLQADPTTRLFVAVVDREVVGFLGMHLIPLCHMDGYRGRVTALIVDDAWRGHGVGTALLQEAERWAAQQGCTHMEITSGDQRSTAHNFYEHRGYVSEGKRFLREIRRVEGES